MNSVSWPRPDRPLWLSAPEFEYVGALVFDLHGARVVRHHYVDAVSGSGVVRRQVIVQLEAFPNDSGRSYRWLVEHPMSLGGLDHEHGVYAWSVATYEESEPDGEVARTARFLVEHGYVQGDGQLMSRFARVVGESRRREVIVFYQEDLAHRGLELDQVADEQGDLLPDRAGLAGDVTARSLAALVVDASYERVGLDE